MLFAGGRYNPNTYGRPTLQGPRQVQAVFEEDWHVVGCCHLSGL